VKLMWLKPHGMLVHRDGQWVPKFDERWWYQLKKEEEERTPYFFYAGRDKDPKQSPYFSYNRHFEMYAEPGVGSILDIKDTDRVATPLRLVLDRIDHAA
jgi:hypothetical protein